MNGMGMNKPTKWPMCLAKTQISLDICHADLSSLGAQAILFVICFPPKTLTLMAKRSLKLQLS